MGNGFPIVVFDRVMTVDVCQLVIETDMPPAPPAPAPALPPALPKPRPLLNEPFTKPVAGAVLWQQARDEVLKKEQLRDQLTNILRKPERIHTGCPPRPSARQTATDRLATATIEP